MTETTTTPDATEQSRRRFENLRPRVGDHLRECTTGDGRKITIDRRCIGAIAEENPGDHNGDKYTLVAFKYVIGLKPALVREGYHDLKAWWRGDGGNGKAQP
jgi:hypothetical protein